VLLLLSKIIYRVKVDGGNNFPINTGGIVIANHVSLLDVLILVATSPRNIRYVMHEDVYNAPFLGFFFKRLNMIPIGSTNSKQNLIDFTNRCKEEIEQGHLICLFPEGQLSRNGHLQGFKKGIENLAKEIEAPIIPMHMDNLTGTPLSFKTGTSKKYGFNFKTLGKIIHVTVGKPILKKITAFELREKVKDLEVINFSKRTKNLSTKAAIYEAKKQVFKSSDAFKNTASLEVENLIINTPNYEVKDLSGKKVILKGTKENTIGRPIPGVNVKIITNEDQLGVIYISHAFSSVLEWMNTGLIGHIDNDGFVAVINN
jgi:1-acyl-sn-glycerol-3-phosphate acyltransferase